MANGHPIDFAALRKGDIISREQIEKAMGHPVVDGALVHEPLEDFRLMALRLSSMIEEQRPDLLTRMSKDTIVIMQDLEADDVTFRRGQKAVASLARNARRRGVIDRTDFTDEQRRIGETRDRQMTAAFAAARKELLKQERDAALLASPGEDEEGEPGDDGDE